MGTPRSWQVAHSGSHHGSLKCLRPFFTMLGSASMTMPRWPFLTARSHFFRRGLDGAQVRNERERNVAIAVLAPLGERVVVGLHAGQLELGVALEERRALHRVVGEQHLAVDAVAVEALQALGRVVDDLRHFVPALREGLAQRDRPSPWGSSRCRALPPPCRSRTSARPACRRRGSCAPCRSSPGVAGILSPHFAFDMRLVHVSLSQLRVRIAADQPVLDLHRFVLL